MKRRSEVMQACTKIIDPDEFPGSIKPNLACH